MANIETTVMLVDDDPEVTRSLRRRLRRRPWDVIVASSAEEALAQLAKVPVDVVVSDAHMPGMKGVELLSRVRDEYPSTLRILLSGLVTIDAAAKAVNTAEIYRFLLKPCPAEEVELTITEGLEHRATREDFDTWRTSLDHEQLGVNLDAALQSLWIGFQPIVRSTSGEVFAYEALARSDTQGLENPMALFAAADTLKRSGELRSRIQETVLRRLPSMPGDSVLFMNVDATDLEERELCAEDNPLVNTTRDIVLEITERQSLTFDQELLGRLASLRDLGYRVAVDDLGSGFSGLNSLVSIMPDFVKLDRELMCRIDKSPTKQRLVKALTLFCEHSNIEVIAEGIETTGERDTAVELGCPLLQGFFFGKAERRFTD